MTKIKSKILLVSFHFCSFSKEPHKPGLLLRQQPPVVTVARKVNNI